MIKAAQIEKHVQVHGETLHILKGISLEIKAAESVAITGTSGSGKSTLLGVLAGLDTPTSGSVEIDGVAIHNMNEDERARFRRDRVGFVFQSFQLLPGMTAKENIMLPAELLGVEDAVERAEQLLSRVGLSNRSDHYPRQLSGGEQQRVAIARAFVTQPSILFADEPTGNLDCATGEQIIDLLFSLNREKSATLVLVTHENRLASLCDRELILEAGQLVNTIA